MSTLAPFPWEKRDLCLEGTNFQLQRHVGLFLLGDILVDGLQENQNGPQPLQGGKPMSLASAQRGAADTRAAVQSSQGEIAALRRKHPGGTAPRM